VHQLAAMSAHPREEYARRRLPPAPADRPDLRDLQVVRFYVPALGANRPARRLARDEASGPCTVGGVNLGRRDSSAVRLRRVALLRHVRSIRRPSKRLDTHDHLAGHTQSRCTTACVGQRSGMSPDQCRPGCHRMTCCQRASDRSGSNSSLSAASSRTLGGPSVSARERWSKAASGFRVSVSKQAAL
jgi:hypothetical protein